MSERLILNKTIGYLKKLISKGYSIYYERRQAGGFNYKIGLPDLWLVINGYHYEIEFKSDENKIYYRTEQLYWLNKFNKINIESIISNKWEDIKKFIDDRLERK